MSGDEQATETAGRYDCDTPKFANDYDRWGCPKCGSLWTANEDDGWSRSTETEGGAFGDPHVHYLFTRPGERQ